MNDAPEVYEVKEGRLYVNGSLLPFGRGLITVVLLRAGWKGAQGLLPLELGRKALALDLRVGFLARPFLTPPLRRAA
jgi:hypothetical protein